MHRLKPYVLQHWALAAIVFVAAVLAAVSNIQGTTTVDLTPARHPLSQRTLIFQDRENGAIAVFDKGATEPFAVLPREGHAFLATALRLSVVERERFDADRRGDFVLTRWSDGGLTLEDLALHRSMELNAYGHSNAQTFADLLPVVRPAP